MRGGNAVDAACAMLAATSTMWDVLGPDQNKGTWVKVTGVQGTRLTVKPAKHG